MREIPCQVERWRRLLQGSLRDLAQHHDAARNVHLLAHVATEVAAGRVPRSLAGLDYQPTAALPRRLASLKLAELTPDARAALLGNETYRSLLAHPAALTEALFSSVGHDRQFFTTTCVPTAMNTAVVDRAPTMVAALMIGRGVVADLDERLAAFANPDTTGSRWRPSR